MTGVCKRRNFDSCNSCKRLVPSRLHELLESKFPFVSRIEFIRSKLSNFSAHVYGVNVDGSRRRMSQAPYPANPGAGSERNSVTNYTAGVAQDREGIEQPSARR